MGIPQFITRIGYLETLRSYVLNTYEKPLNLHHKTSFEWNRQNSFFHDLTKAVYL